MSSGILQLVATPIGNLGDITARAVHALENADVIVCEDTRHSGKLLAHLGITNKKLVAMHQHNEDEVAPRIVEEVRHGHRVVVISDAGTPSVSDPGSRLSRLAVEQGLTIEALPGPTALITALVASGLATDRFCFEGFLPQKKKDRDARLHVIASDTRTTVLYEAPHRIVKLVEELADACGVDRRIALCRELTKLHEEIWRGTTEDAFKHVSANEPRGEYVVVVEGASGHGAEINDETIREALLRHEEAGMTTKDAVVSVAAELGVAKRRVYELAHH